MYFTIFWSEQDCSLLNAVGRLCGVAEVGIGVFLIELVDLGLHGKRKEDERKKQVFHRDI